jgi:hypothetical protein
VTHSCYCTSLPYSLSMKGARNLLILDRRDDLADRLVWVICSHRDLGKTQSLSVRLLRIGDN